jgi:hypothetical protein
MKSEITSESQSQPSKRGRKPVEIRYPDGEFSVLDISAHHPNLSKVSIQQKINDAVEAGKLRKTSKQRSGGRGRQLFSKV